MIARRFTAYFTFIISVIIVVNVAWFFANDDLFFYNRRFGVGK